MSEQPQLLYVPAALVAQIAMWAEQTHPSQVFLGDWDRLWLQNVRALVQLGASMNAAVTLACDSQPARGN